MPRRQWRLFGLTAGGAEWGSGAVVCCGAHPVLGGVSLTASGAAFCVLLAHVLVKQVPGGCGCISWRKATRNDRRSADLPGHGPPRNRGQCGAPGISGRYAPGRTERDAMRFHPVSDPLARPAAYRRLTRTAARGRTVTLGVLAVVTCALVMTACGSQNPPGTASSATSSAASPAGTPRSPASPAGTTRSPSAVGACVTSELEISLTHTTALAGQAGGYLKFTNHSGTPCSMSGWPAVIGLTAAGHATRLRHMQSSMFGAWQYTSPPPAVTLQPGDSAYAIVAADDKPAGGNTRCPAPYVRLRVSPPGDSGSVTISAWLPGAVSYLPACASADGAPTAGTSTITTLSSLPH